MQLRTVFLGNMLLLTTGGLAGAAVLAQSAEIAVSGRADQRLAPLDHLMSDFVRQHRLPGASLAVAKDGRLVYARGFGLADRQSGETVQPESLFRIASLSKPITSVAILQLVEAGRLKLDDRVVDVLGLKPEVDEDRHQRVTIRQCLQHTGGWDRGNSFDPMFQSIRIARVLGTRAPAGPDEVIRFMQKWPLDFDPGTRYAYCNYAYCLLGRVIEKVTGDDYEKHVKKHVLKPLGIERMRIGRTLSRHRDKHEVRYHVEGEGKVGLSVFEKDLGKRVPRAYGAWYIEAMDSHGGWIASASDIVRFGTLTRPDGRPLLKTETLGQIFAPPPAPVSRRQDGSVDPVYYGLGFQVRRLASGGMNQWHTGSLSGTSTLLVRRHDGFVWAVLFNTRKPCGGKNPASAIDPLVHRAVDAVKEWPGE